MKHGMHTDDRDLMAHQQGITTVHAVKWGGDSHSWFLIKSPEVASDQLHQHGCLSTSKYTAGRKRTSCPWLTTIFPGHGRNKSSLLAKIAMQTRQRLVGSTIPAPVPDQGLLYILNNLRLFKLSRNSDYSYMSQAHQVQQFIFVISASSTLH